MPKVFVSYARADQEMVQALIRELQELGYDAFYDQNLTGGQRWWDVLLDQIQSADGFLPVLTSEYRQSEACHREAVWAESLNIPFVPIDLGQASPDLFEKVVAEANWVRYSLDDRASVARLARALGAMPRPQLPSPLPPRPAIPISYFAELEREIRTSPAIPLERQFAIVATLRAKLYTREDASARIMLGELRNRTDITYSNAVDIERMLASPAPEQVAQQQQQAPPVDIRHHRHHVADQAPAPRPTNYPEGYQQGPSYQPPIYAPAPAAPVAAHGVGPYQPGFHQGPQPAQSRPTTAALIRFGLYGVGLLLVILALFAVNWATASAVRSLSLDYSDFNKTVGAGPGDFGLSIAYFKWLGYVLTVLVILATLICLLMPRRARWLVQAAIGLALLHVIFTLVATVTELNRASDQNPGINVSYDAGLFLMLLGVVLMTVASLLPRGTRRRWPGPGAPVLVPPR